MGGRSKTYWTSPLMYWGGIFETFPYGLSRSNTTLSLSSCVKRKLLGEYLITSSCLQSFRKQSLPVSLYLSLFLPKLLNKYKILKIHLYDMKKITCPGSTRLLERTDSWRKMILLEFYKVQTSSWKLLTKTKMES